MIGGVAVEAQGASWRDLGGESVAFPVELGLGFTAAEFDAPSEAVVGGSPVFTAPGINESSAKRVAKSAQPLRFASRLRRIFSLNRLKESSSSASR